MLEKLKSKNKNMAIFSSMDRPIFELVIQYHNLHRLVDVKIAGTDVPYRKPHPAGILKAIGDLKIAENEIGSAVYIGDKETDTQAAHSAGIASIIYYPISHQLMYDLDKLKQYNPEHIITDWAELLD